MSGGTRTIIPARTAWSGSLTAGTRFRVVDVSGGQAADLWAFNAERPAEHLSAQHTRVHEGEIYPRVGWTFVTNERRPILGFVEDTSPGRHDCLVAACDRPRYELLGAGPGHGSCEENLLEHAAEFGIALDHAPRPVNVFANFRVYPDGRLELQPCVSRPGDAATFELLMDAVVVLSACPQDIVRFQPGGPTDMAVRLVAREGLAGMELVEICPPYDVSDMTAQLGCRAIIGAMVDAGKIGRAVGSPVQHGQRHKGFISSSLSRWQGRRHPSHRRRRHQPHRTAPPTRRSSRSGATATALLGVRPPDRLDGAYGTLGDIEGRRTAGAAPGSRRAAGRTPGQARTGRTGW